MFKTRLALAAFAFLACDRELPQPAPPGPEPIGPAPRGALQVSIIGLPGGVSAAVDVSGPNAFAQRLTATTTIINLTPGFYTIAGGTVSASGTEYNAQPATQNVSVVGGSTYQASIGYVAGPPAPTPFAIVARQVISSGLSSPVYLTAPPGDARLFIVEQAGRIRIFKDGALVVTPFLDVTSKVLSGGERGLLSLAFDPQYATNGRFYIYYTDANGDIVVDRHTVSANPDVANTAFDQVITVQHRMAGNHNGGLVMFGPDGMLYLAPGDGGGGGDPENNGQNINSLLGKMLRLNVATLPYAIPPDNPYANSAGADEIWAIGLRNPWRYSFDTGVNPPMLYIADVGQNAWEELNAVNANTAGLNYGWRIMEATHCYSPSSGCNQTGLTLPVHEYTHSPGPTQGCSVTGGFVYRGTSMPEVVGHYFYSDYCAGGLRSFRVVGGVATDHRTWTIGSVGNVTSFGLDGAGEMYMTAASGSVYKLGRQQ
ncbi:MAG TPA: PQQ-dependent sugar dehydrogenase [Gemmatimonadaceae bacterium]|nr:PQQ-dependent sugar dehydrogenase [Gemmatimonadaceae bacterium]